MPLRHLNRKLFAAGVSDELARLLLNIPAVVVIVIVKDLVVKSHLVVQELSYTVLHSSGPSPTQTFWSNVLKQSTLFLKLFVFFVAL